MGRTVKWLAVKTLPVCSEKNLQVPAPLWIWPGAMNPSVFASMALDVFVSLTWQYALLLGHLRGLVHDERLVSKWASDIVLPLINHALATTPNSELGGLTPAELKFGTLDFQHFRMPQHLVPGHHYGEFVQQLDKNLSTVRSISSACQLSLRVNDRKTLQSEYYIVSDDDFRNQLINHHMSKI